MDPMTMMALATLASGGLTALTANKGEHGSTYTKGQRSLIDEMINNLKSQGAPNLQQQPGYQTGMDWLQSLYNDPSFFQKFEAPIYRQFNEQIIPNLSNAYAGMGSGGALGSTGFQNQLAREGSNLATNLAQMRGGMQMQGIPQMLAYAQQPISNYMSMANQALTPTQNVYQPPSAGPFGGAFSSALGGWMQGLANQSYQPSLGGTP